MHPAPLVLNVYILFQTILIETHAHFHESSLNLFQMHYLSIYTHVNIKIIPYGEFRF